jgi:molecular chaperone Hsp33
MGALLKRGQRVALKFEGNGPLEKIIVEADPEGTVRGFVAFPQAEVPLRDEKLNVSGALGSQGLLTVIKDLGLKEPYQGVVKLATGEIAEDIAYYYAESEQIPSAMGLGVFVNLDGRVSARDFSSSPCPLRKKSLTFSLNIAKF